MRPEKLEPAAVRWHGRLEVEAQVMTPAESQLALAALATLCAEPERVRRSRLLVSLAGVLVLDAEDGVVAEVVALLGVGEHLFEQTQHALGLAAPLLRAVRCA